MGAEKGKTPNKKRERSRSRSPSHRGRSRDRQRRSLERRDSSRRGGSPIEEDNNWQFEPITGTVAHAPSYECATCKNYTHHMYESLMSLDRGYKKASVARERHFRAPPMGLIMELNDYRRRVDNEIQRVRRRDERIEDLEEELADANKKLETLKSQVDDDEQRHHKKPRTDSSLSLPQYAPPPGAFLPEASYHVEGGVPVPHDVDDDDYYGETDAPLATFHDPQARPAAARRQDQKIALQRSGVNDRGDEIHVRDANNASYILQGEGNPEIRLHGRGVGKALDNIMQGLPPPVGLAATGTIWLTANSFKKTSDVDKLFETAQSELQAAHQARGYVRAITQKDAKERNEVMKHALKTWRVPEILRKHMEEKGESKFPLKQKKPGAEPNPKLTDPPEQWIKYWQRNHKASRPRGIIVDQETGAIDPQSVATYLQVAQRAPETSSGPEGLQRRLSFFRIAAGLFVIPTLYGDQLEELNITVEEPPAGMTNFRLAQFEFPIGVDHVVEQLAKTGFTIQDAQNATSWATEWARNALLTGAIDKDDILSRYIESMTQQPSSQSTAATQSHHRIDDDINLPYDGTDGGPSVDNASTGADLTVGQQNQPLPPSAPSSLASQLPFAGVEDFGMANSQPIPTLSLSFGAVGPILGGDESAANQQNSTSDDVNMETTN